MIIIVITVNYCDPSRLAFGAQHLLQWVFPGVPAEEEVRGGTAHARKWFGLEAKRRAGAKLTRHSRVEPLSGHVTPVAREATLPVQRAGSLSGRATPT
jgi:hypothetical protein